MKNNSTLRSKYSSKLENIYKCCKETDIKIKYQKFNFQPSYIYDYDETNNILIIYFSNLEEHFNLKGKISLDGDLNKLFKFKKLKKYLDKNNIYRDKKYIKNDTMVRYIYKFEITNKMSFNKDNIKNDKASFKEKQYYITYVLDVYLYSNNNYMNDGTNLSDRIGGFSPDWFYYTHLKKYTYSHGTYFIKNYKNKNKNTIQNDIDESLLNFDLIDLSIIEKN